MSLKHLEHDGDEDFTSEKRRTVKIKEKIEKVKEEQTLAQKEEAQRKYLLPENDDLWTVLY